MARKNIVQKILGNFGIRIGEGASFAVGFIAVAAAWSWWKKRRSSEPERMRIETTGPWKRAPELEQPKESATAEYTGEFVPKGAPGGPETPAV